jgi:RNA polymerase sigma-70 factor (ECF subfamily)
MDTPPLTSEELLASHELGSFAVFYRAHVDGVLGFFCRRTRDAELAADLTAETFAAALAGRRRFRPEAGSATAWLYGIASNQLAYAQRRAAAERRARRRLGMERIELLDTDIERINALGETTTARAWVERLAPDQRDAVTAHVIHERGYEEIAAVSHTSEAVVRKRVSRGLAAVRQRIGPRS